VKNPLTSSAFIDAIKEDGIIVYRSTDVAIANGWHVPSVNTGAPQWQATAGNTAMINDYFPVEKKYNTHIVLTACVASLTV